MMRVCLRVCVCVCLPYVKRARRDETRQASNSRHALVLSPSCVRSKVGNKNRIAQILDGNSQLVNKQVPRKMPLENYEEVNIESYEKYSI